MLIIIGCSDDSKESQTKNVKSTDSITESKKSKTIMFPIDDIIRNSEKRKSKYNLDKKLRNKNKLIPPDFFKKYLANHRVKNMENFELEFDQYSRYYFFDFVEFESFVLFTIIHDDEVGYDNYYHFTYNKESDKITDVLMIASVGGDGGHGQYEFLLYSNSFKDLLVKTKSEYDEDLFDEELKNCYTRISDIYEMKYKFGQNKTEIVEGKTMSFTDTICH